MRRFLWILACLAMARPAFAHERWVKHALKSQFDRSLFDSPGLIHVVTLLAILAVFAGLLRLSAGRVRARPAKSGPAGPWQAFAPTVLRITYGVALVLMATQSMFLAPDLVAARGTEGMFLVKVQGVLGVLLVLGLFTRLSSWGSFALFIWAVGRQPFLPFDGEAISAFNVLNYLEVVGIAIYLGVIGPGALSLDGRILGRDTLSCRPNARSLAVGLMRILLGATLVLLGIQKFVLPELPMGVLQNYGDSIYEPIAALTGISPEGYVYAACIVETTVGLLLMAGVFTAVIMVLLAALFSTTLYIFGEELLAHLPLFGMVFALLLEGSGRLRLDSLLVSARLLRPLGRGATP